MATAVQRDRLLPEMGQLMKKIIDNPALIITRN